MLPPLSVNTVFSMYLCCHHNFGKGMMLLLNGYLKLLSFSSCDNMLCTLEIQFSTE